MTRLPTPDDLNGNPLSAILEQVRARYEEPGRHYHGWDHIKQMFAEATAVEHSWCRREAVFAAIYFHDAIYDPTSPTNEEDSAALLVEEMPPHLDAANLDLARRLVLATKRHALGEFFDAAEEPDARLFLDIDMSILGSPRETYRTYANDIRREYAIYDDDAYRAGRLKVLSAMLAQPSIYLSDTFRDRLEDSARSNLTFEIESLSAGRTRL